MDQTNPLEERLRTMILSNVTISDGRGDARSGPPHRGNHHQRRPFQRGRGPYHHNNAPRPANHMQGSAPMPGNRGGKNDAYSQRGNPWRQNHPRPLVQSQDAGDGNSLDNQPFTQRRIHPPGRARSHYPQNQTTQGTATESNLEPPQGPQILRRPYNSHNMSPKSAWPPASQSSNRQHRFTGHQQHQSYEDSTLQVNHLDLLASQEIPKVEISIEEIEEKEAFLKQLETICKEAVAQGYSGDLKTISLVGFGSLASGFGLPGSDMDLAIVPTWNNVEDAQKIGVDENIPRLLEKAVLENKMGGRLLTRTRVPILKVCQKPTQELYAALDEERKKWDELPVEEKFPSAQLPPDSTPANPAQDGDQKQSLYQSESTKTSQGEKQLIDVDASKKLPPTDPSPNPLRKTDHAPGAPVASQDANVPNKEQIQPHEKRAWAREKVLGPLDFPKAGVGIQCDINFENPLGIHNTHLLRCYSHSDPRVRLMVLFVKSWAKRRQINSSYSGTLSSYGWVLMVLHYLVNIASPPVCPNLQLCWRPPTDINGLEQMFQETVVGGYAVRFWRNEDEIMQAARDGQLTRNTQSIGALLRGFFFYYASPSTNYMQGPRPATFFWTKEVLSLRTLGGVLSKDEKGWTGAKTTIAAGKEVRHRYLFAIEDPFELDHNVARTVTHNGIVAIRDEFRRAWRILGAIGKSMQPEGELFDEVVQEPPPTPTKVEPKEETMETVELHAVKQEEELAKGSDALHVEAQKGGNKS